METYVADTFKAFLTSCPHYLTLQMLDHFVFWVCLRPESSCEHEREDHCQKRAAEPPRGKDPASNTDCGEAEPGEKLINVIINIILLLTSN